MKLCGNSTGVFSGLMMAGLLLVLGGCSGGGSDAPASSPAPILAPSVTLTVAKVGNGTVTSVSGINCGASCTVTVSSGTVVTLTAAPAPGNTLLDWGGACVPGSASCAVTVTANQTVTATFNTSTANPSVTVTSAGTGAGTVLCNGTACNATYPWGTSVTFSATPSGSNVFAGWSVGSCSGTANCTVVLWDNTTVIATFNTVPVTAQLNVTKNGTGAGTVTSNVGGVACGATCTVNVSGGTTVTLTAVPVGGSAFAGWSGGGCSGTGTCVVTMNANTTVTATFNTVPPTVTLTTTIGGTGAGTVTCNGGVCNPSYPSGTALTIVASPAPTSLFSGWSGACASAGTATTCNLTMNANSTIAATFNLPTLSVVLAGTGSVTSNPAGINCGATCTASFNKGTSVTLTASGASFSGWTGGGCSGTGTCVINNIQANASVTATFGGSTSSSTRYHFFMQLNGPLMAIDPATPAAAPVTVASAVSQSTSVDSLTWNATTASFQTAQAAYQIYVSNGKLWRVKAAKTAGVGLPGSATNLPVQISSESAATQVCQMTAVEDVSSPDARRVFYELAGADNQCGGQFPGTNADNITKFVSLSDSAATAPTVVGTGITLQSVAQSLVYNLSTGIATHLFLVNNSVNTNILSIMNLSTQGITPIQANFGEFSSIAVQDTSDRILLERVTTSPTVTSTLYVYTLSSNQLVQLVTGVLYQAGESSDGSSLIVANSTTGVVSRVPLSATSAAQVTPILNVGGPVNNIITTANRVYVVVPVGADQFKVISVPISGGASREDVPAAVGQPFIQASNSLFYYTRTVYSSTFPQAVISSSTVVIDEGGTTVATFPNTVQVGLTADAPYGVRGAVNGVLSKVLLSTYVGGVLNGGTVTALNAETGVVATTVGVVPATTPSMDLLMFQSFLGDASLGFGVSPSGVAININVLFMDAGISNSLVQVPAPTGFWMEAQ